MKRGELPGKLAKFIKENLDPDVEVRVEDSRDIRHAATRLQENIDFPELWAGQKAFTAAEIAKEIGCASSVMSAMILFFEQEYPDNIIIYREKSELSYQKVKKIRFLKEITAEEICAWSKWRKEIQKMAESFAEKFFSGVM